MDASITPPQDFTLLTSLQERHRRLLAQNMSGGATAEDRANLVRDIIASGSKISDGAARDTLRNILYFWVADQVGRGDRLRTEALPALDPFADPPESEAPRAASETSIDAQFREIGEMSASPSIATAGEGKTWTASVLESLKTGAGVLRGEGAAPTVAPASADGAPAAPIDVDKEARARATLRIAALARQWLISKDPEVKRGYLLTGKALAEASLYSDDDPNIHALVEASEKAARRDQRMKLALGLLAGAIAVAALLAAVIGVLKHQSEIRHLNDLQQIEAKRQESVLSKAQEAAARNEKQALEAQIQNAVDALNFNNDLGPLKALLQKYGGASGGQLDRLQLAAPLPPVESVPTSAQVELHPDATGAVSSPPPESVPSPVQPELQPKAVGPAAPPPAEQTPAVGTCAGYLWFGSADSSRLADQRDPATLRPGDVVTLNRAGFDQLRLRKDWPDANYKVAPSIGSVPTDSKVRISGDPRAFVTQPYGKPVTQIWAPVTVPRTYCTTVFIQYTGASSKLAAVQAALAKLQVQTPPAEKLGTAKGLSEVRYFWQDDKTVAQLVADKIGAAVGGELKLVPLSDFPSKPSPGTIEVWIDLDR